ncbi:hypothetical protein, partial [Flavobacterium sp. A45]|uniref:hypothetical protein n=1 Tax=Flavobacterium sp. A45 TaxID=1945862 RepID=UPI000986778E
MQFRKSKIKLIVLLTIITSTTSKTHSQTNSEISLYTKFDSIVGKENLGINNGTLHSNLFRIISKNQRYYIKDEFSIGQLIYDNQIYLNINLKYDLLDDQLVFKHKGQTDNLSINLNRNKINFFIIKNKKFINMDLDLSLKPDFIKGLYEENFIGNEISLYIKHYKERKEINQSDGIYSDYLNHNIFVIKNKKTFYRIETKRDLKKILPEYSKIINDYYNINSKLESIDKLQFMEGLVRYIN